MLNQVDLQRSRPGLHDRFFQDAVTVMGHTPTQHFGEEYKGKILKIPTWINVDTGGSPCLLCLDHLQEYYLF